MEPTPPPLSERLRLALIDWENFYGEVQGDLTDPDIADEFVSQGFTLAHRLRSECKGTDVAYVHPITGDEVEIRRRS